MTTKLEMQMSDVVATRTGIERAREIAAAVAGSPEQRAAELWKRAWALSTDTYTRIALRKLASDLDPFIGL